MELDDIAVIIINGTIGQLGELTGKRSGIGSRDFSFWKLQNEVCFEFLVALSFFLRQLHFVLRCD